MENQTPQKNRHQHRNHHYQKQNEDESYHQCRTVGIALIVETIGHGAKLVFRYPAGPSSSSSPSNNSGSNNNNDNNNNHTFYTLPSRTMEKLFRLKDIHCDRPITLTLGYTIFCCWAVSMNHCQQHQSHNNNNNQCDTSVDNNSNAVNDMDDDKNGNNNNPSDVVPRNKLILFSVIVALIPETSNHNKACKNNSGSSNNNSKTATTISITDPIRQGIQNVHLSLYRLCRILHREEERCEFITHETSRLLQIKEEQKNNQSLNNISNEEYHNALLEIMMLSSSSASTTTSTTAPSSSTNSIDLNKNKKRCFGNLVREFAQVYHALARNNNWNAGIYTSSTAKSDGIVYINNHVGISIDPVYPCRISSPVSSLSCNSNNISDLLLARSYHTLILRHSSADDILRHLNTNGIGPHQYLPKLLLMINPYKSLADIAVDAVVPLSEVLFLSSQLIERGFGTIANVISLSSQYACTDGKLIQDLALKFAQRFGTEVPIGIAISVITSRSSTLGAILSNLHSNILGIRLQEQINSSSKSMHGHGQAINMNPVFPISSTRFPTTNTNALSSTLSRGDPKRDIVCSMVAWLRAHEAIVELKEYLISIADNNNTAANPTNTAVAPQQPKITNALIDSIHKPAISNIPPHIARTITPTMLKDIMPPRNAKHYTTNKNNTEPPASPPPLTYKIQSKTMLPQNPNPNICPSEEEELYAASLKANYLNGTISTDAFCWKMSIDLKTLYVFKEWGQKEAVLKCIWRCPMPGDDWT